MVIFLHGLDQIIGRIWNWPICLPRKERATTRTLLYSVIQQLHYGLMILLMKCLLTPDCNRAGAVPATQRTSHDPAFFSAPDPTHYREYFNITWLLLTSQVRKPKILGEVCQTLIQCEGGVWERDYRFWHPQKVTKVLRAENALHNPLPIFSFLVSSFVSCFTNSS